MDVRFAIRAGIFFVAGLVLILFPKQVLRFQLWFLGLLRVPLDPRKEYRYHPYVGAGFIVIALLLLAYALSN